MGSDCFSSWSLHTFYPNTVLLDSTDTSNNNNQQKGYNRSATLERSVIRTNNKGSGLRRYTRPPLFCNGLKHLLYGI